jgi:hypothetical protein
LDPRRHLAAWAIVFAVLACGRTAAAQELEPGAYTVSPVGVNVVGAAYSLNKGDVSFDPSLPIDQAHATTQTLALSFTRAVNLAGRSGTFLVALPLFTGHVEGLYLGQFQERSRTGPGDIRVRVGMNLYGAPAMDAKTFVQSAGRRRTTIGASLTVVAPTGQYDDTKVINIGGNRWAFKPEVALTHNTGVRWMLEAYGGVWLFTDNQDFVNGGVRAQQPIVSVQFHVRYTFRPGLWLSVNSNFYAGGRTSVNGQLNFDLQKNSRLGGTLMLPLPSNNAIRIAVSDGAYTTVGADFRTLAIAFQHAWGGGR